jgi:histidinol-phosphatase (PHP family)
MCASAVENGLSVIAFTDHFDVDFFERHNLDTRQKTSYEDIVYAREVFADKITVMSGIEMGQPTYDIALTEKSLARYEYDFVIGSIHNVRGHKDFYDLDYRAADLDAIFKQYYDELDEMVEWGKFDVVGHINYFERYAAKQGVALDVKKYYPRLSDLFIKLIAKGKGIEVNTAGLFAPVGKPQADEEVLRLYKGLGGKIVTIGSDSHQKENIGRGNEQAQELLRRVGFEYVTVYEDRTPRFVRI